MNPEVETSYTMQYPEAFLKYVDNEYCAKHRHVPVNKLETLPSSNLVPSATASGSYQSSFDPYDSCSDDEEYLTPNNVAETTPGQSDRVARLLSAAWLYLNSPPEAPMHWGQINPNLNEYHSDPMEISSAFWIPDIIDWWRQQEETHQKCADLSNVERDIFSIMPHGVGVEATFSLHRDVIGWRQSENDSEMKEDPVQSKVHRMAKVHDCVEMWQGSQNIRATQKESCSQNKQMTAVGYISDTEEIVNVFWSLFQHDSPAAFKLSERSLLPPALSAKDLPGGRTQILNVRRTWRINHHPVESDKDRAPASISDTNDWLN